MSLAFPVGAADLRSGANCGDGHGGPRCVGCTWWSGARCPPAVAVGRSCQGWLRSGWLSHVLRFRTVGASRPHRVTCGFAVRGRTGGVRRLVVSGTGGSDSRRAAEPRFAPPPAAGSARDGWCRRLWV